MRGPVRLRVRVRVYLHMHMCAYVRVPVCVCVHACVRLFVYILDILASQGLFVNLPSKPGLADPLEQYMI